MKYLFKTYTKKDLVPDISCKFHRTGRWPCSSIFVSCHNIDAEICLRVLKFIYIRCSKGFSCIRFARKKLGIPLKTYLHSLIDADQSDFKKPISSNLESHTVVGGMILTLLNRKYIYMGRTQLIGMYLFSQEGLKHTSKRHVSKGIRWMIHLLPDYQ